MTNAPGFVPQSEGIMEQILDVCPNSSKSGFFSAPICSHFVHVLKKCEILRHATFERIMTNVPGFVPQWGGIMERILGRLS